MFEREKLSVCGTKLELTAGKLVEPLSAVRLALGTA